MCRKIVFLGFAGSLRKDSYNKALLRTALEVAPENVELEIFDLEGIPAFNQDHEDKPPAKVREFKRRIRAADALLIATPEYNYSVPGVLKNAIDWASRPYGDNAFEDKPVALMSASEGMLGGARAQYHLRQTLTCLNMHPLNRPEVAVASVDEKIDEKGNIKDRKTKERIKRLVEALVVWTERLKQKT